MNLLTLITTAIVPIVLLLAAGVWLRRRVLRNESFWSGLEWMCYRVFTPALFITSIGSADLSAVPVVPMLVSLVVPTVVMAALVWALRKPIRASGPAFTSILQGSIRINTYIGLIIAGSLHGSEGVAVFALACAVIVPLVNLIAVTALSVYGDTSGGAPTPLWKSLVNNPLIQGSLIGLAIAVTGVQLPVFLSETLDILAAPALTCGTLIAGAALRFTFRRRDTLDIALATTLKLIVLPLAGTALAISLGVSGTALTAVVVIFALPIAPTSTILASRMGGDTRLMAAVTGFQTVVAMMTVPVILLVSEHWAG